MIKPRSSFLYALAFVSSLAATSQWYHNIKDAFPKDQEAQVRSQLEVVADEALAICESYNAQPDGTVNRDTFYGDTKFSDKVAEGESILRLSGCSGDLSLSCKVQSDYSPPTHARFVRYPITVNCPG